MENIQPNKIQYSDPLSVIIDKEFRDLIFGKDLNKEIENFANINVLILKQIVDYYHSIPKTIENYIHKDLPKNLIAHLNEGYLVIDSFFLKSKEYIQLEDLRLTKYSELTNQITKWIGTKLAKPSNKQDTNPLQLYLLDPLKEYSNACDTARDEAWKSIDKLHDHIIHIVYQLEPHVTKEYLAKRNKKEMK
jgi:hypothetical protein